MRSIGGAILLLLLCALASGAQAHARHHHHHYHRHSHHHGHLNRRFRAEFDPAGTRPVAIQPEVFARPAPFNPFAAFFSSAQHTAAAVADVVAIPRGRVFQWAVGYARQLGVPPRVAVAVTIQESGGSCTKIGGVGERGPMQVRPETAAAMGLHPRSCQEWTRAGVLYLKQALDTQQARYGLWRAVSAYNHGWGRVYGSRYGSSVLRIMAGLT